MWIPSLYFAEGLPYVAVMTLSVVMYKKMGLSDTDLAFYTSWFYLPWVIKPLWSPIVDALKTKRWWILAMQILIGAGLAGIGLTIPTAGWLKASICLFWLIAFSSATHDIAADGFYILSLDSHQQSIYVGIRSTFYRIATIFAQGLLVMLAGMIERIYGNIPLGWTISFFVLAALFILAFAWHNYALPKPSSDVPSAERQSLKDVAVEFWLTLKSMFSRPQFITAVIFMLLFRLPEAQLVKIAQPFMLSSQADGGLGLSTEAVGFAYGTVGMIGLTLGGILGGFAVAVGGLKKWLWPMVASISIPDLVYVYLSYSQTSNLYTINACVFIEQFGYGFGFTAYMLFMIYFARGNRSTAVYAICTAIMALGMMLPGLFAGKISDLVGYKWFFIWVMACCIATVVVSALLKIDPKYGMKEDSAKPKD